jgi:predicted DNA-binding antitoxin AbrB/MazE fold protein
MFTVEAVYQGGVFRPIGEVKLEENQRVRLVIEPEKPPMTPAELQAWLEQIRAFRQKIYDRNGGPLPDSALSIAEDRMRDV